MTTNIRRGNIPNAPSGVGPCLDEIYTQKGFFGDWSMVFRSQNIGHPVEWSNDDLMNLGADTNLLKPTDLTDPAGAPLPLLKGDGVEIPCRGGPRSRRFSIRTRTTIRSGSTIAVNSNCRRNWGRSMSSLGILSLFHSA
jgi:hypothetical protein